MEYKIIKHYLKKNDCYKAGKKRTGTAGIVKHSTGANNPYLRRYIDDPDGLGKNIGNNHWNMAGIAKCVHFFIGLDKNGDIAIYQTLPLDYRCWGCGSGSKGSYNNTHVQYEICEDGLADAKYFEKAFAAAAWLDAYICRQYGLKASAVVSHKEAHEKGYASNHGDCDHWLKKQGKTMAWARAKAQEAISGAKNEKAGWVGDKSSGSNGSGASPGTVKPEAAKSKDPKLAGTYTVATKTDPPALNAGAGTGKAKIASLAKGSTVQCYGYYTAVSGIKWLLVTANGKTGFVHCGYLKKQ